MLRGKEALRAHFADKSTAHREARYSEARIHRAGDKLLDHYAPDMPDPDLVIRTSGELRMSNFLLWQLAYSEFFFVNTLWPDFGEEELRQAVAAYAGRQRRFGRR